MLATGVILAKRYSIESVLGRGGMGAVYLARMEALGGKRVAIKEMTLSVPDGMKDKALAQFQTEARLLANLDHPNLVQVTDFFEEGGHHYLVMAYVDGETLSDRLKQSEGPLRVPEVLEWARQLCSVLDYLHNQNPPIIFRDLKPSNIMLDAGNRIKLIDFGIARSFNPESVTCTFIQGMGTQGYSPLEQYGGAGSTDPRSDQYALGATLYHLLTGEVPISPVEILSMDKKLPSPRTLNPNIPVALDKILMRSLGVRKEERYPTVADMAKALARLDEGDEEETANLGTGRLVAPAQTVDLEPTAPLASPVPAPLGQDMVVMSAPNSGVQPFWMATAVGLLLIASMAVWRITTPSATASTPTPTATAAVLPTATTTPTPTKSPASKPTATSTSRPASRPTPRPAAVQPKPKPAPVKPKPKPKPEPEIIEVTNNNYPRRPTRKPKADPTPDAILVPVPVPTVTMTVTPTPQPVATSAPPPGMPAGPTNGDWGPRPAHIPPDAPWPPPYPGWKPGDPMTPPGEGQGGGSGGRPPGY